MLQIHSTDRISKEHFLKPRRVGVSPERGRQPLLAKERGCRTNVRQLILYIQHKTPSFEKPGVRGIISLCD